MDATTRWFTAACASLALVTGTGIGMLTAGSARPDSVVRVDTGKLPCSGCWYEVGLTDQDGKPGGAQAPRVEIVHP